MTIGSTAEAYQGADIFLIGHPGGQDLTVTKGVISRIENEKILTDAEIDPGFSGGPMLLSDISGKVDDGIVIGVVVSAPIYLNTVREAVPIDVVMQRCASAGHPF